MRRFYTDDAGRVLERATGACLGRVDAAEYAEADTLYWPLDPQGVEVSSPTMVRALAILKVIRAARPGVLATLLDVDDGGR